MTATLIAIILLTLGTVMVARDLARQEAEEAKRTLAKQKAEIDLAVLQFELGARRYEHQQAERDRRLQAFSRALEQQREEDRHRDILFEMQEANRIARDGTFDAEWFPVYRSWREEQALSEIGLELHRLRVNQESIDAYWLIHQRYQPLVNPYMYPQIR